MPETEAMNVKVITHDTPEEIVAEYLTIHGTGLTRRLFTDQAARVLYPMRIQQCRRIRTSSHGGIVIERQEYCLFLSFDDSQAIHACNLRTGSIELFGGAPMAGDTERTERLQARTDQVASCILTYLERMTVTSRPGMYCIPASYPIPNAGTDLLTTDPETQEVSLKPEILERTKANASTVENQNESHATSPTWWQGGYDNFPTDQAGGGNGGHSEPGKPDAAAGSGDGGA